MRRKPPPAAPRPRVASPWAAGATATARAHWRAAAPIQRRACGALLLLALPLTMLFLTSRPAARHTPRVVSCRALRTLLSDAPPPRASRRPAAERNRDVLLVVVVPLPHMFPRAPAAPPLAAHLDTVSVLRREKRFRKALKTHARRMEDARRELAEWLDVFWEWASMGSARTNVVAVVDERLADMWADMRGAARFHRVAHVRAGDPTDPTSTHSTARGSVEGVLWRAAVGMAADEMAARLGLETAVLLERYGWADVTALRHAAMATRDGRAVLAGAVREVTLAEGAMAGVDTRGGVVLSRAAVTRMAEAWGEGKCIARERGVSTLAACARVVGITPRDMRRARTDSPGALVCEGASEAAWRDAVSAHFATHDEYVAQATAWARLHESPE